MEKNSSVALEIANAPLLGVILNVLNEINIYNSAYHIHTPDIIIRPLLYQHREYQIFFLRERRVY